MNLFYTINDTFVPQLGAAICSVCENNKSMDSIHFYIGAMAVSDEHQEQLRVLVARYGRRISFIPIDHLQERLGFDFDTLGWNEVVLARLLVDQLLPPEVDRVLYLDGDTIVRGNLQNLWDTDLKGCPLGASIEPTVNRSRRKGLGLDKLPYYNAGVLLIDLQRWKESKVSQRVLDFYRARNGRLFANDQDALNGALPGEIFTISPKYNFYNIFWYYPYRTLVHLQKPAPYVPEDVFQDACDDPAIIHYLGEDRPWRRENTHRFSSDFHKYLAMTPWKDTPLEEGWELYFKFYKAFLTLGKPFPLIRYHIIDSLIPLVMRWRKRQRIRQSSYQEGESKS